MAQYSPNQSPATDELSWAISVRCQSFWTQANPSLPFSCKAGQCFISVWTPFAPEPMLFHSPLSFLLAALPLHLYFFYSTRSFWLSSHYFLPYIQETHIHDGLVDNSNCLVLKFRLVNTRRHHSPSGTSRSKVLVSFHSFQPILVSTELTLYLPEEK